MTVYNALRRTGLLGLAVCAGLMAQSALATTPAGAFLGYANAPSTVFGAAGSGNGDFSSPAGVAVDDSTGDVYVVDQGNARVEKFDAEGKYLGELTGAESPTGSFAGIRGVAVDNSSSAAKGDLYVADGGHGVIDVFGASGKYLSQITGAPSSFTGELYGVAVDTAGDVWAYESSGSVDEFSDTGSFITQFNTDRGTAPGVALDSSGNVYVLSGCGCVGKFSVAGANLAEWGEGRALAVNEATNNVFLDTGSEVDEFGAFGEPYGVAVDTFGAGNTSASEGVAVNDATRTVYVSQHETDTVDAFKSVLLPDVTTGVESRSGKVAAKLEGIVNPDGDPVGSCEFEYGTSSAYGQTAACTPAPGSGLSPVAVSAEISGLSLETTYYFRLVAGNANGLHAGSGGSFTTPSAVEGLSTSAATAVAGTSATLNGSLEPNGLDATYLFEYGPCLGEAACYGGTPYGQTSTRQDAGSANGVMQASASLVGLEPNELYHFRIVAENVFGTTTGKQMEFTTPAVAPAIDALLPASTQRVTTTVSWMLDAENSATSYRVLYGATSAYGELSEVGERATLGPEKVAVGLSGLMPNTTYHYALQAINQAGTVTGPDETFTTGAATPPTAATGAASEIELTSATVSGTIDPEGLQTSYEVDFGVESSYGSKLYGEAGVGTEAVAIAVPLQNLAPGTTYHYRIVAISSDGTVDGADETFTTPVYSNPIVLPFTLPLIASPAIAFPAESQAPTGKKAVKKKTKKYKAHKQTKTRKRTKAERRGKTKRAAKQG